ncbi:MAG: FAD binding domain-containing protein [Pararobbsia sp.]
MIPRPFEYHAPRTLPEALSLLHEHGDAAKLLAGGHSLLPMMKLRFAEPGHLIDLGKLAELKGIRETGAEIRIGAMTTEKRADRVDPVATEVSADRRGRAADLRSAGPVSRHARRRHLAWRPRQ